MRRWSRRALALMVAVLAACAVEAAEPTPAPVPAKDPPAAVERDGAKRPPHPKNDMKPEEARIAMMQAFAYYDQFKLARKAGDEKKARECLVKITQMHPFPRHEPARKFLGGVYLFLTEMLIRQKALDKAWDAADEGLKRTAADARTAPSINAAELYRLMSKIRSLQGKRDEAEKLNKLAIEIMDALRAKPRRPGRR